MFHARNKTPSVSVPATSPERLRAIWRALRNRESWRLEHSSLDRYSVSESDKHSAGNRYSDISPFDGNLVRVSDVPYVHASRIRDLSGRRWIAAQGPMTETVEAFWSIALRLPDDEAPRIVVQLTALVESGREKCSRYTHKSVDKPFTAGSVTVRAIESEDTEHWTRTKLEVGDGERSVSMQHLNFQAWPDHGVPSSPAALLSLIAELKRLNEPADRPILVHCSAGVGRTGTTLAVSALQDMLPALELPPPEEDPQGMPALSDEDRTDVVIRTIDNLKDQRMLMVQTQEQLQFVYRAFEEGKKMNKCT